MDEEPVVHSVNRDHRNPPDVEDDEFEEWAEQRLADVEYDTDLGTEMGRDAIRLARGEISQEEFNASYHDDVLEEFGVDDRPTKNE